MEEDEDFYEARLDKIFAHGGFWEHRTFRTILDPFSHEWSETDFDKKLEILEKVISAGEDFSGLIMDYKLRYDEQNRRDISRSVEQALIDLLQYSLKKKE